MREHTITSAMRWDAPAGWMRRSRAIGERWRSIPISPRRTITWATCCWILGGSMRPRQAAAAPSKSGLNYAEAHDSLGNALLARGQVDAAAASYRRALELQPNFAEAHNNLGNALLDLGQLEEAMASYRRALALKPDFAEAHNNLGSVLRGLGQLEEAMACFRRAIALKTDFAEAHGNLGIALRLLGRTAEAEASCRRALEINPNSAATIAVLAESCADQGQFAEAEGLFKRAISMSRNCRKRGPASPACANCLRSDTAWLAEAQKIAGRSLPPRKEAHLRYAIGKYFDDVGDFASGIHQFPARQRTSKIMQSQPYDRREITQAVDRIIQSHDREWLSRAQVNSISSERPVFIVGMLRSGTTLAEQILASHPAVFGAGELPFWTAASAAYRSSSPNNEGGADLVRRLGEDYLRLLQELSVDALRVVDKMPTNFWCWD